MSETLFAFAALSAIIVFGTIYSVVYGTYLDTSDPLITHLAHPLSKSVYWANKSNFLNVYFIKKAWAWTSGVFLLAFFTSPASARTARAFYKWVIGTLTWYAFTSWFFGPPLFERVIVASGGQCVLSLPAGNIVTVPQEYCHSHATLSPATHPDLFASVASTPVMEWAGGRPRLRLGHDVSGHIFLLTMSVLLLSDQLKTSLRAPGAWSMSRVLGLVASIAMIAIWLFASYTTSVYFHSPLEKATGYVLGVAAYVVTQLPELLSPVPNQTRVTEKIHTS
ncbi:hypothetical protein FISHEDRAFT_42007 [Fistulina hepatica ATCC 64428]|uniref:FIT family protein scs3 n=1 Tax=Fistulina hepatica ATCC 64428 TaxID=1128425 RepID=A0A0D7AGR6_9AGAR|nr:hypothetical protein FISHEDRAFT_42007 [Fistulina hepatica ATCC 64428]